jgi:hypothetical protein
MQRNRVRIVREDREWDKAEDHIDDEEEEKQFVIGGPPTQSNLNGNQSTPGKAKKSEEVQPLTL